MKTLLFILSLTLLACQVQATTYYVGNDGSDASDGLSESGGTQVDGYGRYYIGAYDTLGVLGGDNGGAVDSTRVKLDGSVQLTGSTKLGDK